MNNSTNEDDDDRRQTITGLEVIEAADAPMPEEIPVSSSSPPPPTLEIIEDDNRTAPLPVEHTIAMSINNGSEEERKSNASGASDDIKDPTRMSDMETVDLPPPTMPSYDPDDIKVASFKEELKKLMDGGQEAFFEEAGQANNGGGGSEIGSRATSTTTALQRMGNSPSIIGQGHPPGGVDEESLTTVVRGPDGVLVERYTVLEATVVDDVVYDAVPFSDQTDKLALKKRQSFCALISLAVFAAAATGIIVAAVKSSNNSDATSTRSPDIIVLAADGLRADWVACTDSLQCSNGCCSGTFSQGIYTCTPLDGGYLPGTCIGEGERQEESRADWVDCNSSLQCTNGCCSDAYSEGFWKCTPLVGGYLGDPEICISHLEESQEWENCTTSDECSDGCCSGTYTEGVLKCTPLVGGYRNDTCVGPSVKEEESIGDWVECSSSLQCANGCCSNAYSEGFWKCTPLIGGYLGDPEICMSHAVESRGWENCTTSDECGTGCCSGTYSEGVLKCTPLYGGYRNDTCIGIDVKEEESIGDWVECSSSLQCTNGCCSNAYSEGFWKCTPLIGGYLGDPTICMNHTAEGQNWEDCTTSDECGTGCCSGTYTEGVLKCTPLYGGYRNDTCVGIDVKEEASIEDWVECSSSLQCTNGCCSNAYSEGFWKCTPLIGGYLGDPEICMSHAVESRGWQNCTTSEECSSGCCSSTYSEGVPKCTPLYGGYRNDTCVGEEV